MRLAVALLLMAVGAHGRSQHIEYVALHRAETLPDLVTVQHACSTLSDEVKHLWSTRHELKDKLKARVNSIVDEAVHDTPLAAEMEKKKKKKKGWFQRKNSAKPPQTLLEKTTLAATVASRTASMARRTASRFATAALTEDPPAVEAVPLHQDSPSAHFSHNDVQVSTTLVSRNAKENSVMLAKLKERKKQQQRVRPAPQSADAASDTASAIDGSALQCLIDPLIPQTIWNRLTGKEFPEHMELLQGFAQTGYRLAANDDSDDWIAWTKVTSSFKEPLEEGAINVWTGQARRKPGSDESFYGASAPFIKTRSIIPMSPMEVIELMLDSSRVKTYNQWSVGRLDLWKSPDEKTKIVQNTNQVPMGKKPLRSTTLLHACPVVTTPNNNKKSTKQVAASSSDDTAWLLLSRAVGPQPEDDKIGTSDILLGVNLLQPVGNGQSQLTAITHVYSSAVPGMLAQQLGVKSAINFVKDLRKLVVSS